MRYKKIILGIFFLLLLSNSILFIPVNRNLFETEIQDNPEKNRELRNSATKTATLRPNGDILTEWDGSPTPHWSRINEVSPDDVYARWIHGDENETEIYAMENLDIPNFNATKLYFINVTTIEVHAYGDRYLTGPANVSIYFGEWTPELELDLETTGSGWRTLVWNNLDGTYDDLKNLQVKIKASDWCSGPPRNGYGRIDTLYCDITYDIVELPGDTATLRPNEDILTEWDGAPTPHWSRINEVSPDGVYARWIYLDISETEIFDMEEAYFENAIITKIELHVYGRRYYTGPAFASISLGEWTPELELNLETTGSGWRTLVWNNLDGTYDDLKDLQVKIKAGDWCSGPPRNGYGRIDTLYCVITIEEPQFQVTSPENKSYTEPMSGYYPATYGFENDVVGSNPEGWYVYEGGGTINVISSINGHNNVLELNDSNIDLVLASVEFSQQSYGTIEFYLRTSDASKANNITIMRVGGSHLFRFGINSNNFKFNDGSWKNIGKTASNNAWYHISLHFECTNGGYMGLAQYNWKVDIDGETYGNYNFISNEPYADKIDFHTPDNYYYFYIDALGFSGDPYYNAGDNLKEGLLVSYQSNINFNWTGYSLNGQDNITFSGNTTIPMPEDGADTIQLFGNNSKGYNYFSEIIHFYVDINSPIITITSPSSDDFFGSVAPDFEISVDDLNVNTTWYNLNNGINITTDVYIGAINQTVWEGYGDGLITIRFYVNDTWGHEGYSEVSINKDTIEPTVAINFPLENEVFGKLSPLFDLSVVELNIGSMWYSLDGGSTNITFQELRDIINQNEWDKCGNGTVNITFYVKDEADNEGSAQVTIRKEATPPLIRIISPNENDFFSTIAPTFEIAIQETDLDTTWYTLDDGVTKIIFTGLTGSINQTEWNKYGTGSIVLKFYANDTYGFENFTQVTVHKDISAPIITITSPSSDDFFGSVAPDFEISVDDLNVNTTWYNLNNGINITTDVYIGAINQTVWEGYGDGLITIRFYANDTLGHTAYSEVSIYKDITAPTSVLTYIPYEEPNIVNKSTSFAIVAFDGSGSGIYVIQYKINDSSWIPYTGPFNLFSYDYGVYLITYQAIDLVDNIETANTLLVNLIEIPPEPSRPPAIPGYNLVILVGIISVISILTIKSRIKKLE